MDKIAEFMTSPAGRWLRIGTGALLVATGIARRRPTIALLGLVPLIDGLTDQWFLAPLLGLPVRGYDIRKEIGVLPEASLFPPRMSPAIP